jgi:hypothetical protein
MSARRISLSVGVALGAIGLGAAAPHSFLLTYRDFGAVSAAGDFQPADGYAVRFEGCYAKHSAEAVCGFTLRAGRALTVANRANLSHAAAVDGTPIRTCCIFVQGDPRGYPITPSRQPSPDAALLERKLAPGETTGFMLRIPNYKVGPPVAAVTFSHGDGDPGRSFPTGVIELP